MKIVKQSVELIRVDELPTQLIEKVGQICYKSEDRITDDSASKFVEMLGDRGHFAMIEHAHASFHIVTNRGVCYSADTDVLTDEGWQPWPEIRGDERFATLDPNTGVVVYQLADTLVRTPYDGRMYCLQTSLINLCVTPEHKMYVQKHDAQAAKCKEEPWQLLPAQEIVGKRVSYKRDAEPIDAEVLCFTVPDFVTYQGNKHDGSKPYTKKGETYGIVPFAKFLGYWIAAGSLDHQPGSEYRVELFQNRGPVLDDMLHVLREMGYNPNVSDNGSEWNKRVWIIDAALYAWLRPYHGALNKRIPREVLNTFGAANLKNLLECYIAGDGSTHEKSGHLQAYTVSVGLVGDLQEAALKVGISATTWIDNRVGEEAKLGITNRHPCHVVSFVTTKNTPLVNHGAKTFFRGEPHESWIDYTGTVYCVTVPNHTLYVRRNGRPCWSGNSHELVRHRLASAQESTRYCNYRKAKFGREITVIQPPGLAPETVARWRYGCEEVERIYFELLDLDAKPQIARSVLPICLKTEICITTNFREYGTIFGLRLAPAAHPEMRVIAYWMWKHLVEACPAVFERYRKLAKAIERNLL